MNGLVIRTNGEIEDFNYNDMLGYLMRKYTMVEDKNVEGGILCLYADVDSVDDYNNFEFEYRNYRGDVFVIYYDENERDMIDITEEYFLGLYREIIDIEDETDEETDEDDYDYEDYFIVDDRNF